MIKEKIPVGISDFEKIREERCYYVDKTALIREFLEKGAAEVTLITRPRPIRQDIGAQYDGQFLRYPKGQPPDF